MHGRARRIASVGREGTAGPPRSSSLIEDSLTGGPRRKTKSSSDQCPGFARVDPRALRPWRTHAPNAVTPAPSWVSLKTTGGGSAAQGEQAQLGLAARAAPTRVRRRSGGRSSCACVVAGGLGGLRFVTENDCIFSSSTVCAETVCGLGGSGAQPQRWIGRSACLELVAAALEAPRPDWPPICRSSSAVQCSPARSARLSFTFTPALTGSDAKARARRPDLVLPLQASIASGRADNDGGVRDLRQLVSPTLRWVA